MTQVMTKEKIEIESLQIQQAHLAVAALQE
jgi:hypothetical protein